MKIARSVNRLGTEAVYSIFAKTKKLAKQGKKIIDLSLGQSDFKSPKHVVDTTIEASTACCGDLKSDWPKLKSIIFFPYCVNFFVSANML